MKRSIDGMRPVHQAQTQHQPAHQQMQQAQVRRASQQESLPEWMARADNPPVTQAKRGIGWSKITIILPVMIGLVVTAFSVSMFLRADTSEVTVNDLVGNVSSLVEDMPSEKPSVSTVADAESIKHKEGLFKGVEDGDSILLFGQSQRAIVYRQSSNKIVSDTEVSLN